MSDHARVKSAYFQRTYQKKDNNNLTHLKQTCHVRVDLFNEKLNVITHLLPECMTF